MTRSEFDEWFALVAKRFGSVGDRLTKQDAETNKACGDGWYGVVRVCKLEHAKAALDEIQAQGAPYFDRFPSAVRKYCDAFAREEQRAAERRRHGSIGEQTFTCQWCHDSGWVDVAEPSEKSVGVSAPCMCSVGGRIYDALGDSRVKRFTAAEAEVPF